MAKSNPTIEQVKVKILKWRRLKRSRGSRMPQELLDMARALCARHKVRQVCKELGLDYRQLVTRGSVGVGKKIKKHENAPFVTVTLPERPFSDEQMHGCEFIRVDGARLRVNVATTKLSEFVGHFLGGAK